MAFPALETVQRNWEQNKAKKNDDQRKQALKRMSLATFGSIDKKQPLWYQVSV